MSYWHAELGGKAYLNDKPIEVSQYTDISKSVVSVGMSKTMAELEVGLSIFQDLLARARKCRMMGSAALDLAYVAQWTVGYRSKRNSNGKLSVIAWNGKIDRDQLWRSIFLRSERKAYSKTSRLQAACFPGIG